MNALFECGRRRPPEDRECDRSDPTIAGCR
jgi:hypothetical protein